ncbi:MAG: invasion protein CiaB [Campylobacter sp.]|nr:invasion protein CiaB [Campylobacter sp.]
MNDFKKLKEILAQNKAELNDLYKNLDNKFLNKALKLTNLSGTKSEKIALLRRIVDLKADPLENELKKLGKNADEIIQIKEKMYDFVRKIYEKRHFKLIQRVKDEKILDEFYTAVLVLMHECGLVLNAWQIKWDRHILQDINIKFDKKFKDFTKANEYFLKHEIFMRDENGQKADRVYGAVQKNGKKYEMKAYGVVFKNEVKKLAKVFDKHIKILKNLAQNKNHKSYINYFKCLKNAFCEEKNDKVIPSWQKAEIAWMKVRGEIQPGHPLEYYEDAYTHAVALEWDIRLAGGSEVDEIKFKQNIKESYAKICDEIGVKNENMNAQVQKNVDRTQLYVSVPMIYYAAELNGLFSAQVVPNDESVSAKCGKKIFAFVDHVYANTKARPFMKLSKEIFEQDFLDFEREILFTKPQIWKKVYEISTIGHEFGHILFIDKDTENSMNKGGEFKFIEEYKATSGGLINFFLHEDEKYKLPVFGELIARAVGLIAWMKVDEVRAYYCEGLIHLSLLFASGVLSFDDEKLKVNFSLESYEKFKVLALQNYKNLALHYSQKKDAGEFLAKFCEKNGVTYLPKDAKTREFVEYFYSRYEAIGNEIDESDEWAKWQKRANAL